MSDQFTFQDFRSINWFDSESLKSQKSVNYTVSDVSKTNFQLNAYQQDIEEIWNVQEFNKKAHQKQKNKINAKNFRQRKKTQNILNEKKMKFLIQENALLKKEKFCRHCKKPFGGLFQCKETLQTQLEKTQFQNQNKSEDLTFEKPQFFSLNQNQKQSSKTGKIWIALGILMLVIGIHLYGFRGKQNYKQISISKVQSESWISNFENKQNFEDYFNVKMKLKGQKYEKYEKQKEDKYEQGILKQIKILYEQEAQQNKQLQNIARNTINRLRMVEQKQESNFKSKQEQIKINKELLYSIQAQIDDIGNYL